MKKHIMDEKLPSLPPSLKKIDYASKAIVKCIVSTFHFFLLKEFFFTKVVSINKYTIQFKPQQCFQEGKILLNLFFG